MTVKPTLAITNANSPICPRVTPTRTDCSQGCPAIRTAIIFINPFAIVAKIKTTIRVPRFSKKNPTSINKPTDRKKTTSKTLCIGRVLLRTICLSDELPTIRPAKKLPKAVDKPIKPEVVAQTPQNAKAAIGTTSLSAPKAWRSAKGSRILSRFDKNLTMAITKIIAPIVLGIIQRSNCSLGFKASITNSIATTARS